MDETSSTYGRDNKFIDVLVGNPEENRQLGIPNYRWERNIKIDLQETVGTFARLL
jgi:hypothetical protein